MTIARPVFAPLSSGSDGRRVDHAGAASNQAFSPPALFAAFEQLDRMTRHDGRDRVLVDELRMPIPPQQHAKIVEPGHNALQA